MEQIIIHVDMDAFFASVEIRDNPSLKGKPLIIGSLPNERGVVSTCSYEARPYGIHSGMNIKEAYRLCPQGIYMHPNIEKYAAVSKQLHEIWYSYASAAEAIALDEAYLEVTQKAQDLAGAREIAHLIKKRTKNELGLTCSVGVGYSKTSAKTASEEKKPDGYFEIPDREAFVNLIIDRDVRVLYTVGNMTAEKLYNHGIHTVRDLREHQQTVIDLLGKQGLWLTQLALGNDSRKVVPYNPEEAKSISREVTFQKDVDDFDYLKDVILLLACCVRHRAQRIGLHGRGVNLKITYADMKNITRSAALTGNDSPTAVRDKAVELLNGIEVKPVRLIGVGINRLSKDGEIQLSFDDVINGNGNGDEERLTALLSELGGKYGLDFEGHLEEIYRMDTLHKTIEYMRKHKGANP